MYKHGKIIGGYRLTQNDRVVIIDERKGIFSEFFDLVFGSAFMFPLALFIGAFFPNGFFGVKWESSSLHYPIWKWLIFIPFLCIPIFFALAGAYVAFSRIYIEITKDKISTGSKWFNLWASLKVRPISDITAISLYWTRRGPFAGRRVCGVFIVNKSGKIIELVNCVNREDALKLAKAILEKTNLSLEDIPNT